MNGTDALAMQPTSRDGEAAPLPSSERAPAWPGALALVFALLAIAWFFLLLVRDVEAAEFDRVDMTRTRVDCGPGWFDPRWSDVIAARLAELPAPRADDPATHAEVAAALASLSFVAEVRSVRVLWPDGLELALRLREPVACVRAGEQFVAVSGEGVVLTGAWSLPPAREHGFLPVIALTRAGHAEVAEGNVLTSPEALDGLAVANALWRDVPAPDMARLGRAVIDALDARSATVEQPGAVLWLEYGRRVYFGRTPNLDAPGELPPANKLVSLVRALAQLDALDWELADVRWDRPELLPRGGLPDAKGK